MKVDRVKFLFNYDFFAIDKVQKSRKQIVTSLLNSSQKVTKKWVESKKKKKGHIIHGLSRSPCIITLIGCYLRF
jgi:hypothetical protein